MVNFENNNFLVTRTLCKWVTYKCQKIEVVAYLIIDSRFIHIKDIFTNLYEGAYLRTHYLRDNLRTLHSVKC